jgi:hypothetical protein
MRCKILFLSAAVALLLGFVCLAAKWHGDASVNVGWPGSVNTVKFCGTATGGFALIGFLGLLLGIILFLAAVIDWITKKFRTRGPVTPQP